MHSSLRRDGLAVRPSRAAVSTVLVAGLLVGSGCTESPSPARVMAPQAAAHSLTHDDSTAQGYFARRLAPIPSSTSMMSASSAAVSTVSVTPGTFQGADQPSTITAVLSGPVVSVTVTGNGAIQCSGTYGDLIAYDAAGQQIASSPLQLIDQSDCSTPANPDNVTYGATATVLVTTGVIAKIEITPMSPLTFTVLGNPAGRASQTYSIVLTAGAPIPCPPVGDAILDAPGVVGDLTAALAASSPNAKPGTGVKHEVGGAIWKRPDGTYFTVTATDPNATECHFDPHTISPVPPANEPGAMLEGIFHTHPSGTGEDVYGCTGKGIPQAQKLGDGKPIPTATPNKNGGGSDADWDGTSGYPSYTINKDGYIWRLDPGVAKKDRSKNTNKFDFKNATPGCVIK